MDKGELRRRARTLGPVDAEVGDRVVSGICVWLSGRIPGTVSAYLAMSDEVDVAPLFDSLPGWRWVLPRVEDDDTLTFRDRDVPRETHPLGMLQPVDSGTIVPLREIDVLLVPGLVFDLSGRRLGRGRGFYDRVLDGRRTDAVAMGVTTRSRLVDEVPVEGHDRHVDWLATECGVRERSPTR